MTGYTEAEAVGVEGGQVVTNSLLGQISSDISGQEQRGTASEHTEKGADRQELAGLLLPLHPPPVGAWLDLGWEVGGVVVKAFRIV